MRYIKSADQLADMLTKALPKDVHRGMMYLVMGNNPNIVQDSQRLADILPDRLYDARQAGLVERANRTLKETSRTLLHDSQLPLCFWPYALTTAAYCNNRLATRSLVNLTPYEAYYGCKPDLSNLHLFGSV